MLEAATARSAALVLGAVLALMAVSPVRAQRPSPPPAEAAGAVWLRIDPLAPEMALSPRESFEGVPARFLLMTDGHVYVGGRNDLLRGFLDRGEMQEISTRLDAALKALGKSKIPETLKAGEGEATLRFSSLLGTQFHIFVMGPLDLATPAPPVPAKGPGIANALLMNLVRRLAGFRHPSLRPFDPPQFLMFAREQTLRGGCRDRGGLPAPATVPESGVVVDALAARGFPTGAALSQVCEGGRRFAVALRPIAPGER